MFYRPDLRRNARVGRILRASEDLPPVGTNNSGLAALHAPNFIELITAGCTLIRSIGLNAIGLTSGWMALERKSLAGRDSGLAV